MIQEVMYLTQALVLCVHKTKSCNEDGLILSRHMYMNS